MRLFYIDYENVKDSGLNGIAKLTSTDIVKIFYSEDAQRMSFGTHRRIVESKAVFIYKKIGPDLKTLKNMLDALLLHDLESAMKTEKCCEYFIVSKDTDFDEFIEKKRQKKYKIKRIAEVCQASVLNDSNEFVKNNNATSVNKIIDKDAKQKKVELENDRKKKEQVIRSYIGKYLKEYSEYKEDIIVEAYMKSSSRQELNNELQKLFKNDAVSEILAALKNLIKDWPGR